MGSGFKIQFNETLDQVNFVEVQLVNRNILWFFTCENYKILLNTAAFSQNLLDPIKIQTWYSKMLTLCPSNNVFSKFYHVCVFIGSGKFWENAAVLRSIL